MAVKISASMGIRCLVTSRISSRNYFTDNLGCVIGSEPDRNSDGFKVRIFLKILPWWWKKKYTRSRFFVEFIWNVYLFMISSIQKVVWIYQWIQQNCEIGQESDANKVPMRFWSCRQLLRSLPSSFLLSRPFFHLSRFE